MKSTDTIYRGCRIGPSPDTASDNEVTRDDQFLSPEPSLKLRNHSPDGFNWGYGGSGPAQLALAILLDFTEDPAVAERYYQYFKHDFVSAWEHSWKITGSEIKSFLAKRMLDGHPIFGAGKGTLTIHSDDSEHLKDFE